MTRDIKKIEILIGREPDYGAIVMLASFKILIDTDGLVIHGPEILSVASRHQFYLGPEHQEFAPRLVADFSKV